MRPGESGAPGLVPSSRAARRGHGVRPGKSGVPGLIYPPATRPGHGVRPGESGVPGLIYPPATRPGHGVRPGKSGVPGLISNFPGSPARFRPWASFYSANALLLVHWAELLGRVTGPRRATGARAGSAAEPLGPPVRTLRRPSCAAGTGHGYLQVPRPA